MACTPLLAEAVSAMSDEWIKNEVVGLYRTEDYRRNFGVVKLEEWPEGLVLWVGGQIRWESFRDPDFWNVKP
jgi:hypothetical protein